MVVVNNRRSHSNRTPHILDRNEPLVLVVHSIHVSRYSVIFGRQRLDGHPNKEGRQPSCRVRNREGWERRPQRVYRCRRRSRALEKTIVFFVERCVKAFATSSTPCPMHLICCCRQREATVPSRLGPAPSRSPSPRPGHGIASPPGESGGHRRSLTRACPRLHVRFAVPV